LGTGEGQALIDIPDDFRLEMAAVIFQKAAHADGIGEGAERLGAFHGLVKIRLGFLDDDARLLELARRLQDDFGHFRIDRGDAEIAADGDTLRLPAGAGSFQVGSAVRREREGIGWLFAHHGIKEQGEVFDVAGHGAFDAKGGVDLAVNAGGNAPGRGPHADNAAEAGGIAQRAAKIRAMGEPGCACRQGHCGAAR